MPEKTINLKDKTYTLRHEEDAMEGEYVITAHYKNKQVGVAVFNIYGSELQSDNTDVIKSHRRKGIATAMYDFASETFEMKVVPASEGQTTDAQKFWQNRLKNP